MPYPSEHAARMIEPGAFQEGSFRRKELAEGLSAIMGRKKGEQTMTVQAYRFAREKFTPEQAKAWLKEHNAEPAAFEEAAGKEDSEAWRWRADKGELLKHQQREDGTLLLEGFIARPGVYVYRQPDGAEVRELVPRATLHDPDSLATLARTPVTLEHPTVDESNLDNAVNPDNYARLAVGDTDGDVEIVRDTGFVRIKLAARRRDAIDAIHAGTRELSPGYRCQVDATPGIDPEFGAYDAIQLHRRYNHCAIVDRARGGREIAFRADGAVQVSDTHEDSMDKLLKALLAKLRTDGADRKAALSEFAADLAKLDESDFRKVFSEMDADLKAAHRASEKLQGQLDAANARIAELEKTAKDKEAALPPPEKAKADRLAWAAERAPLLALAEARKVDGADKLDNAEIRRAIAKTVKADLRDDASAEYVSGIVETLLSRKTDGADPWAALRIDGKPPATDDKPPAGRSDAWADSVRAAWNDTHNPTLKGA